MTTNEVEFRLVLTDEDSDPTELDSATRQVMTELQDLGAASVERVRGGPAPDGAKGDPIALGSLAVTVLPEVLPKLVGLLQSWMGRREHRSFKIETRDGRTIEASGSWSAGEIAELITSIEQAG